MKQTLLELVQDVISDIGGDYTNSLSDNDEAEQIAQIFKNTYFEIIEASVPRWEHLKRTIVLDSSGDLTKPTHMQLNDNVYMFHLMRYNKRKSSDTRDKYLDVEYCTPEQFLDLSNARDSSQSNVTQITDFGGAVLTIRNDIAPTWYTTFDDEWFVFDSWDSSVESTLQSSKTQAIVTAIPTWTTSDSFIPDLPPHAFSLLLEEARSVVWNSLRQTPNQKAEQRAQRQRRNMNLNSHRINTGATRKIMGRRSRK